MDVKTADPLGDMAPSDGAAPNEAPPGNDQSDTHAVKSIMQKTMRVMALSGRLHRSGLLQVHPGQEKKAEVFRSRKPSEVGHRPSATPALETIQSAVDVTDSAAAGGDPAFVAPPPALSQTPSIEEEEVLQMLKDSYREVTGHAIPDSMTVDEAYAELRLRTMAAWQGEDDIAEEEEEEAGSGLSVLEKLRKGIVMTKISLRAIGPMKLSKKGPLELKDDDWDAEMLQMLQASYREVTGRAMPKNLTPAQAELELRRATAAMWREDGYNGAGIWTEMIKEEAEVEAKAAAGGAKGEQAGGAEYDEDEDGEGGADPEADGEAAKGEVARGEAARVIRIQGEQPINVRNDEEAPLQNEVKKAPKRMQTGKNVFRGDQASGAGSGSAKIYEGWLVKKPGGAVGRHHRRWFVLHEDGEVNYYASPELTHQNGSFSVRGIGEGAVELLGFLEVGKYGLTIKTQKRLWHLSAPSDGQCKAWRKNLVSVINGQT